MRIAILITFFTFLFGCEYFIEDPKISLSNLLIMNWEIENEQK